MCYFFFSSRRRHTRFDCDWSSDVCSSDLDLWPVLSTFPAASHARSSRSRRSASKVLSTGHKSSAKSLGGLSSEWKKIGRASGRGRGEVSVGGVSLKKKK